MVSEFEMYLRMGAQYLQIGKLPEAQAAYETVLRSDPDNRQAHESLGVLHLKRNDYASAYHHFIASYDSNSNNPHSHGRLGDLHESFGQFDEARACFRRAMALKPEAAPLFFLRISRSLRFSENDEDIAEMEELFNASPSESFDRVCLAFALGKAFDDLREYPKAFSFFLEGNRIAADMHPFAAADLNHQNLIETFDQSLIRRCSGNGVSDLTPIFVVGTPRSGSTLTEQIVASHSAVFAGGESGYMDRLVRETAMELGGTFPNVYRRASTQVLHGIAQRYMDELKNVSGGQSHVTDKSMDIFRYLGMIGATMPHAKVVHCSRDPRDQGLSCFQRYFDDEQSFSYDLKNIAKYLRTSENLMSHWKEMFPDQIFSMRYENLVSDPEKWTRKLLEYCELPFEPECLSSHVTKRAVLTHSTEQVRRPIYSSSVGRWKDYEQELQPLIQELGRSQP